MLMVSGKQKRKECMCPKGTRSQSSNQIGRLPRTSVITGDVSVSVLYVMVLMLAHVVSAGEHIKVGTGRSGEGAGLLLQQAARGGAAVPGAG